MLTSALNNKYSSYIVNIGGENVSLVKPCAMGTNKRITFINDWVPNEGFVDYFIHPSTFSYYLD